MTHEDPSEPQPNPVDNGDPSDSPTISQAEAQRAYRYLATAVVVILATGTVVYHLLEDWSWVDSFYFSAVAVTTVGFGDFTPTTDASKLFTVAYVFAGIAVITTYINVTLKRRSRRRMGRH